jgi:hypothetical protein
VGRSELTTISSLRGPRDPVLTHRTGSGTRWVSEAFDVESVCAQPYRECMSTSLRPGVSRRRRAAFVSGLTTSLRLIVLVPAWQDPDIAHDPALVRRRPTRRCHLPRACRRRRKGPPRRAMRIHDRAMGCVANLGLGRDDAKNLSRCGNIGGYREIGVRVRTAD